MAIPANILNTAPGASALVQRIEGREAGPFRLSVVNPRPVRPRLGWLYLTVALVETSGEISQTPAVTGIVSGGGRGVKPWFECRLYPEVVFADGRIFDARGAGVEAKIVDILGQLVPPGGHLMLDYENAGQEQTFNELVLRVPPATSYLGFLMFKAGCRGEFKDWYFSEGGHEGPRKLQANKSPNQVEELKALRHHREALKKFLMAKLPRDAAQAVIVSGARDRAKALLKMIEPGF